MTSLPPISVAHPLSLIGAVFTPWIALGIALLIGYFASYLTALSWADLTFVMPATALGNVFVALLAHFWLHEQISWMRWMGIVMITVGVAFVAHGPANTTRCECGGTGAEELRMADQRRRRGARCDVLRKVVRSGRLLRWWRLS